MTQIKLKHSVVKDKKPTAADLPDFGEVALNAHVDSPGLYTKGSDGSIITLVGSNTSSGDNPMDGRYVQKAGDDMTGNLTLGTDKITLGVDGSAEFASGGITFDNAGSADFDGDVSVGGDASGGVKAGVNVRASGVIHSTRSESTTGSFATYVKGDSTPRCVIYANGSAEFASGGITFDNAGSAEFKGDVAIGDSTTFRGSIGDAVALLPNGIVEQFKTIIDDLPKAQPYGATTLPAELPTPLRDALERHNSRQN